MSQVFSNLLGNAVQHGAYASPITVEARREESGLAIEVHNEGTAIPQEIIPKIFDSLFQGSLSEKANDDYSTSLGLGLYIARELVLAHGGTVEVRSSDAEGTTFVVHLPSVRPTQNTRASSTIC
jgi:phosphoserine phosphatase RsbU/P